MSEHADTIRHVFSLPFISVDERDEAVRSLDALLAENQRYEKALEQARGYVELSARGHVEARDLLARIDEALAGDTESQLDAVGKTPAPPPGPPPPEVIHYETGNKQASARGQCRG